MKAACECGDMSAQDARGPEEHEARKRADLLFVELKIFGGQIARLLGFRA